MALLAFNASRTWAVGLYLTLASGASASAAILSHVGSNDPVNAEGWTTAGFQNANVTGSVAPDSTPSWRIDDASSAAFGQYTNNLVPADLPGGIAWTQTVELRVASSSAANSVASGVHDGTTLFQFHYYIGNDQGTAGGSTEGLYYFTSAGVVSGSPLIKLEVNDEFHTFDFAYDPINDEIDISYDGASQTSLARSAFFAFATTPYQQFGASANTPLSDSRWAEVSLTVVPEPSGIGMMALALLVLPRFRTWARRS